MAPPAASDQTHVRSDRAAIPATSARRKSISVAVASTGACGKADAPDMTKKERSPSMTVRARSETQAEKNGRRSRRIGTLRIRSLFRGRTLRR